MLTVRAVDNVVHPVDLPPVQRIDRAAERLTALLRRPAPVPLRDLAAEVDALGEAAVQAIAAAALRNRFNDVS